jgi:hypothetical protein
MSAFSSPTLGEKRLIEMMAVSSIRLNTYKPLSVSMVGGRNTSLPLVFIIPIWGDMDLKADHFAKLRDLAQHPTMTGRPVLAILHGDRHAWDKGDEVCPIHAKLKSLFYYSDLFWICPEKLDSESAGLVIPYLVKVCANEPAKDEAHIACIARLLGRRPNWRKDKKHIGFYDAATGESLLLKASNPTAVLDALQMLDLNSLELNHAGLEVRHLQERRYSARYVVSKVCSEAEWVNLAANNLVKVNADSCRTSLRHLYLHKNAIQELNLPAGLPCQLQSLSLYRNQLTELDLPADQISLVKLNLGANPICRVPEVVRQMRDLKFLGLARTRLHSLPNWLHDMPQLQEVDLSHMLNMIPIAEIRELAARGINIIFEPGRESYVVSI